MQRKCGPLTPQSAQTRTWHILQLKHTRLCACKPRPNRLSCANTGSSALFQTHKENHVIEAKKMPFFGEASRKTKKLFETAYSIERRIPFFALKLRSAMKGMDMTAYYEGSTYCGFSVVGSTDEGAYVYYLAASSEAHNADYSEQIVESLKSRYAETTLVVDVEAHSLKAANNAERAAKRKFYLSHGFAASGYGYKDAGVFEILVHGEKLEPSAYSALINKLAFGLTPLRARPMKELS